MQHAAQQHKCFGSADRGVEAETIKLPIARPGTRDWIFKLITFYESSHSTAIEFDQELEVMKCLKYCQYTWLLNMHSGPGAMHGLQLEGRLSQWLFEMEILELNVHPTAFNVPHTHDGMIICRNLHWFSLMCPTIHDTMNHCIQVNDYLIDQSLTSTDDMRQFSGHY